MATSSKDAAESLDSSLATLSLKSTCGRILAEYLPRLSLLSLYITLESPEEKGLNAFPIIINEFDIVIPFLNGVAVSFEGVTFVPYELPLNASLKQKNVLYYRVVVQPPPSSVGSPETELVNNCGEDVTSLIVKSSQSRFIPIEGSKYLLSCSNCTTKLSNTFSFQVVRQMPGLNWQEKAVDLWCHPPSPCTSNNGDSKDASKNLFSKNLVHLKSLSVISQILSTL